MYQIYPRSFADSNGDGIGDLPGILGKVEHLARLGVDVVWLSPVYRSPQDDNGYDISDYQDIDPTFGTLEDMDALIVALHERDIRLVMDLVVNHTSDEHAWFEQSRDPQSPKRDWYIWRPPRDGILGQAPNNWGSYFSGPAWELDERSGDYFLHQFSRKQPDLNWENPELREAVYAMMRWWLDRGVDGFRMDVINLIAKPDGLPDGAQPPGALYGNGQPLIAHNPRLHDFLQEMYVEVFAGRPDAVLTVGETPSASIDEGRLLTDPSRRELDMVFQFEHVDLDHGADKFDHVPLDLTRLKASFARWQTGLAGVGWNSLYWNNHDQPRIVSRWGEDAAYRVQSATLLATVLHLHQGTPYIYQGEELGMTNTPFAGIDEIRDIESVNAYHEQVTLGGRDSEDMMAAIRRVGRDNARTPMHWSAEPHAGFTTGTPWIDVNPNYVDINAQAQVDDEASVFAYYQRLIELRHTEPLVVDGTFALLAPDHPALFAFTRTSSGDAGEGMLVLANHSSEQLDVPAEVLTGWDGPAVVIGNYADPPHLLGDAVALRPWEAVVYRR